MLVLINSQSIIKLDRLTSPYKDSLPPKTRDFLSYIFLKNTNSLKQYVFIWHDL